MSEGKKETTLEKKMQMQERKIDGIANRKHQNKKAKKERYEDNYKKRKDKDNGKNWQIKRR